MSSFTDAEYIAARRKLIELEEKKASLRKGAANDERTQAKLDEALRRVATTVKTSGMRRAAERELLEQLALVEALRQRDRDARIETKRLAAHEALVAAQDAARDADARVARAEASTVRTVQSAEIAADVVVAKTVCETAIAAAKERDEREVRCEREREASRATRAEAREAIERSERRRQIEIEAVKAQCATQRDSEIAKARSAAAKAAAAADAAFAEARAARSERDAASRARAADAAAHAAEKTAWEAKVDADMGALDLKVRRLLASRDDHISRLQADLKRANHDRNHYQALLADLDTHVVAVATHLQRT